MCIFTYTYRIRTYIHTYTSAFAYANMCKRVWDILRFFRVARRDTRSLALRGSAVGVEDEGDHMVQPHKDLRSSWQKFALRSLV